MSPAAIRVVGRTDLAKSPGSWSGHRRGSRPPCRGSWRSSHRLLDVRSSPPAASAAACEGGRCFSWRARKARASPMLFSRSPFPAAYPALVEPGRDQQDLAFSAVQLVALCDLLAGVDEPAAPLVSVIEERRVGVRLLGQLEDCPPPGRPISASSLATLGLPRGLRDTESH